MNDKGRGGQEQVETSLAEVARLKEEAYGSVVGLFDLSLLDQSSPSEVHCACDGTVFHHRDLPDSTLSTSSDLGLETVIEFGQRWRLLFWAPIFGQLPFFTKNIQKIHKKPRKNPSFAPQNCGSGNKGTCKTPLPNKREEPT